MGRTGLRRGLLLGLCLLLAGCADRVDLAQAQIDISLLTPLQRNLVKDQRLLAVVQVRDDTDVGVKGLDVQAQLYDAAGDMIQTLVCQPDADKAGRYVSLEFVPPAGSKVGDWRVQASISQGDESRTGAITVHVDDTLGAQMLRQHGLYLPIPPSWAILDQTGDAEAGRVILDPAPDDQAIGQCEIVYCTGAVGLSAEALTAALATYTPQGLEQVETFVRQVIPVDVQEQEGLLARGGLVGRRGNHDANLDLQSYRFHCAALDRSYTVTMVSDSSEVMSRMAALVDGLYCGNPN